MVYNSVEYASQYGESTMVDEVLLGSVFVYSINYAASIFFNYYWNFSFS